MRPGRARRHLPLRCWIAAGGVAPPWSVGAKRLRLVPFAYDCIWSFPPHVSAFVVWLFAAPFFVESYMIGVSLACSVGVTLYQQGSLPQAFSHDILNA